MRCQGDYSDFHPPYRAAHADAELGAHADREVTHFLQEEGTLGPHANVSLFVCQVQTTFRGEVVFQMPGGKLAAR